VRETEYNELIAKDPKAATVLFLDKDRALAERDQEIEKLRQHLINATKARFGPKSEKLSAKKQQELFSVDELVEAPAQEELPSITIPEHKRKIKRSVRNVPEGTPVKRVEHPPVSTSCNCCGKELVRIREEVTKILNYIPASFEIEEHVRPVMACNHCKESSPVTTPLPEGIQLIPRSPVGVGLLNHILISKYQDHIPLYRQEGMFARLGFDIPRKRMCEWLSKLAEILHPLYKEIKRQLIVQRYLQADETTVKIQDGEEPGKCHTGYFWGLLSPPLNLVYFHYADSRAGEVPKAILSDYQGILQTDLYAGYNTVYVPEHAVRAGCWAHVRRKLLGVQKLAEKDVQLALGLIAKLYRAESIKEGPELILAARKKHSTELIEKLFSHLSSWSARTLPQSEVKKSLTYALCQWEALTLFLTNPHIALDNNLIENQMRPIAIGRKNWLFSGSHEGAMRSAIFFSLINSCRLNKINTWHYFNDILPRLARSASGANLEHLLPNSWAPSVNYGA